MGILSLIMLWPILMPAIAAIIGLWPQSCRRTLRVVNWIEQCASLAGLLGLGWMLAEKNWAVVFSGELLPGHWLALSWRLDGLAWLWMLFSHVILSLAIVLLLNGSGVKHRAVVWFWCLKSLVMGLIGAGDLLTFYLFWESLLVPSALIIGIWGHQKRLSASVYFWLYNVFGSGAFLCAIIALYAKSGNLSWDALTHLSLSPIEQCWIFLSFLLAFLIKIPLLPVHTWLPRAHVEAPTEGSMVLAGVLLKLGIYGILRWLMPLFPMACHAAAIPLMSLSLITMLFAYAVSYQQRYLKKSLAYASIAHMGLTTFACFLAFSLSIEPQWRMMALQGAVFLAWSHGLTACALFALAGILAQRQEAYPSWKAQGLADGWPVWARWFTIVVFLHIGLPGSGAFIGEWLTFMPAFHLDTAWGACSVLSLWLGAWIGLEWLLQWNNGPGSEVVLPVQSLQFSESCVLWILVVGSMLLGLCSGTVMAVVEPSLHAIVHKGSL